MKAIVRHVLNTRWNDPWADEHFYIWGGGLTPPQGSYVRSSVFFEQLPRPDVGNVLCWVFMLGKVADWMLGLSIPKQQWVKLDALCVDGNLVRAYWPTGRMVGLSDTHLYQNHDGVMYLVVSENKNSRVSQADVAPRKIVLINFSGEGVDRLLQQGLIAYEQQTKNRQVLVSDNNSFAALKLSLINQPTTLVYQQGMLCQLPDTYDPSVHGSYDVIEDASIVAIKKHDISACTTFYSLKDVGAKKAILPLSQSLWEDVYPTDLEVYWGLKSVPTRQARRILDPKILRLLTQAHVSINLDLLANITGLDPMDLVVYLVERPNGRLLSRQGTQDHLDDFMHLPQQWWPFVLSGYYNDVSFWSAPVLENSSTYRLMDKPLSGLTEGVCFESLSHSGCINALIPPPTLVTGAVVDQGLGFNDRKRDDYTPVSVALVVDQLGRLFKHALSALDQKASLNNNGIVYPAWVRIVPFEVKPINGLSSPWTKVCDGSYIGQTLINDDLVRYGFKAYVRPVVMGVLRGHWEEVSVGRGWFNFLPQGDQASNNHPVLRWNPQFTQGFATLVRIPHTALVQEPLAPNIILNGLIDQGVWEVYAHDEPNTLCPDGLGYGSFTIYLGGRVLTPFVDYVLHDDRVGYIVHKMRSFTHQAGVVKPMLVVGYGYPKDPKRQDYGHVELGFVKDGVVSRDQVYAPLNEQRTLTLVGGVPSTVVDDSGSDASTNLHHPQEGKAYVKFAEPYPLEIYGGNTNQSLVNEEQVRQAVVGFCTQKVPQASLVSPSLLGVRHRVVSVLCCRILCEIDREMLNPESLRQGGHWQPQLVDQVIQGFSRELRLDICRQEGLDWQYFEVWPHPYDVVSELSRFPQLEGDVLGVDRLTYLLIEYVSQHYLSGRVDPSPALKIV